MSAGRDPEIPRVQAFFFRIARGIGERSVMARRRGRKRQPDAQAPESKAAEGQPEFPENIGFLEERERMIAEAAYFRAERRGFAQGNELLDWLEAEAEIDSLIQSGGPRAARSVQTP